VSKQISEKHKIDKVTLKYCVLYWEFVLYVFFLLYSKFKYNTTRKTNTLPASYMSGLWFNKMG